MATGAAKLRGLSCRLRDMLSYLRHSHGPRATAVAVGRATEQRWPARVLRRRSSTQGSFCRETDRRPTRVCRNVRHSPSKSAICRSARISPEPTSLATASWRKKADMTPSKRPRPSPLQLTAAAKRVILRMLHHGNPNPGAGLRLQVFRGRARGFSTARGPGLGEATLSVDGIRLFVPEAAFRSLLGATIDLVETTGRTELRLLTAESAA